MYKDLLYRAYLAVFIVLAFVLGIYADKLATDKAIKNVQYVQINIQTVKSEPVKAKPIMKYIGEFTLTGYTDNSECCGKSGQKTASGTQPIEGKTDWTTLPAGTEIYIEGYGYYTVEDKVANWITERYDGKIIDLFRDSYNEAKNVGKQKVKVYIVKEN